MRIGLDNVALLNKHHHELQQNILQQQKIDIPKRFLIARFIIRYILPFIVFCICLAGSLMGLYVISWIKAENRFNIPVLVSVFPVAVAISIGTAYIISAKWLRYIDKISS